MAGQVKLQTRSQAELRELPLVEVAYELLALENQPFYYRDLMERVATLRGMTREEVENAIARLYTDMNIDGRFLCIGENVWGLRRWYPTEKTTERGNSRRFLRKDMADYEDEDSVDIEDEELLEDEPPYLLEEEEEEDFEEDVVLGEDEDYLAEESLETDLEEETAAEDEEDDDDESV